MKSEHKPNSLSPSLNCESDGEEYVLCFIVIWTNPFDDLSCSYANRPGSTGFRTNKRYAILLEFCN